MKEEEGLRRWRPLSRKKDEFVHKLLAGTSPSFALSRGRAKFAQGVPYLQQSGAQNVWISMAF